MTPTDEEKWVLFAENIESINYARTRLNGMRAEGMICELSDDLKAACELYHITVVLGEQCWLSKLVDSTAWILPKIVVWHAMDTLSDWMIIYRKDGATSHGRAGFNWFINECNLSRMEPLYEQYWKNYRQ